MITATYTTASLEALTRRQIIERFLRDSGMGQYGTATGGSTSSIVDTTKLKSTQFADDDLKGVWARISYDAGGSGAAPEGEISPATGSTASSGTVTVNPVFTAAPANGDKYQLFRSIHPQDVLDTLDQILTEECYLPDWTLLTEVPDGDMEQNNTTDWTAGSGTLTKVTSEPSMWGKRWARYVSSGSNDYFQNANAINVIPGKKYHVSALVQGAASTTAQLIIYDNTNGAAIATLTSTEQATVRLGKDITIPSGCRDLRIRMGATATAKTTHWDEVCVYQLETRELPLPFWVKNKQQVKGIFRPTFDSIATDTWAEFPRLTLDENRWDFLPAGFGRGQTRILRRDQSELRPVYLFGTRPESVYANENSEVKRVDANFINAALCFHAFDQLMVRPNAAYQELDWVRERKSYWEKEYSKQKRKQEERINDIIQTATPDALVYANQADLWRVTVNG